MWRAAETNTHQDHVIAHVIGASVLGHFVWDETAYLLLDIGFIWNLYLDGEMGLVPHGVAISELEADKAPKDELRADIDRLLVHADIDAPIRFTPLPEPSPIQSVELLESEDGRRLVLTCDSSDISLETSLMTREITISAKE
jgi:hypothetical protein